MKKELRLCVFSRIDKTKGVEDAIEAVKIANKNLGDFILNLTSMACFLYHTRKDLMSY